MNKISIISSVIIFLSTYNIESQRFNRNHIILPPTICSTANLADLSDYIQNANPTGNFDGPGVTHNNGIFSFNATTAGIGTQTISYTYVATTGCAPITITASIEVLGNCGLPFISQIYSNEAFGREKDRFIEIKNKSQNEITAGTYYLAVYNYPNTTSNAPDSFIDIGAMSGLESKVFSDRQAMHPQYAVDRSLPLPSDFNYRCKSIIILTTTTDNTAYANRVDIGGQFDTESCGKSWVRSSCATQYPRTDIFDIDDWVDFEFNDPNLNNPDSMSNAILTTHHHEDLVYNFNGEWEEDNLPIGSSVPDKSRSVFFGQNFIVDSNLEVCSLELNNGVTVTVPAGTYVRSQISVMVNPGANLDIQSEGSLIMVKDSYNGVAGPDLVQLNNGAVSVTKNTGGLDAAWDYVYWASPLTANPVNLPASSINSLFASPRFSSNSFFGWRNANFFDGF